MPVPEPEEAGVGSGTGTGTGTGTCERALAVGGGEEAVGSRASFVQAEIERRTRGSTRRMGRRVQDGGGRGAEVSDAAVGRLGIIVVLGVLGCGMREPVPAFSADDARFGRLAGKGEPPSHARMCGSWLTSVVGRDEWTITHVSFPETNVQSACFTPVRHDGRTVSAGAPPRGCSFPAANGRARLEALADELDALADDAPSKLFPCSLTLDQRSTARRQNVRALRAIARDARAYPYSAVVVPGHGVLEQNDTALARFLPGHTCKDLADGDLGRLGALPFRTARAADALRGGVAPVAIVSGGAVHSRVIEAFAMMQLLECREQIAPERIMVEPCAEHTHTNLRNSGRWMHAMGARAAYLLTDDWLQSTYLQDATGFEYLMGTPDQRSLRDWGYVMGSWRQASVGIDAGFWFTPYRFWAEPKDGVGGMTCVDLP